MSDALQTVTVTGLWVYPIKACAAVPLQEAVVEKSGLRFDRRWMLVDTSGKFLTQRDHPQLACVVAMPSDDTLLLQVEGSDKYALHLLPDTSLARRDIKVWGFSGDAVDEGDTVAAWLSRALKLDCRLVRTPSDFARRVRTEFASDDPLSFADGYPSLLASDASLADLNQSLAHPVPMDRFRPNITVEGAPAWAEETWSTLEGPNGIRFRTTKPCARCAVTTVDQINGVKTGPEPLATLAKVRPPVEGKVNFGMNLVHEAGLQSALRVGDTLAIHR